MISLLIRKLIIIGKNLFTVLINLNLIPFIMVIHIVMN